MDAGARKQGSLTSTSSSNVLSLPMFMTSSKDFSGASSAFRRLIAHMPMMFFWKRTYPTPTSLEKLYVRAMSEQIACGSFAPRSDHVPLERYVPSDMGMPSTAEAVSCEAQKT